MPLDKSADALDDRAQQIMTTLGYTDRPADTARGFLRAAGLLCYVLRTDRSAIRWDALANAVFPSLRFWYRTSPRDLEPLGAEWTPRVRRSADDRLRHDVGRAGHRRATSPSSRMVPPQVDEARGTPDADGLEAASSTLRASTRTHSSRRRRSGSPTATPTSARRGKGRCRVVPDITLRVEAAGYRGRPAFFQIVGPWTRRPAKRRRDRPAGASSASGSF